MPGGRKEGPRAAGLAGSGKEEKAAEKGPGMRSHAGDSESDERCNETLQVEGKVKCASACARCAVRQKTEEDKRTMEREAVTQSRSCTAG